MQRLLSNFSWYHLLFTNANASGCSQALQNGTIENITTSRLPLTLEFAPGIKTVQGIALEMGTLGNFTLCYQSIVADEVSIYVISNVWRYAKTLN